MKTVNLDQLERMTHLVERRGVTYAVRTMTVRIANMVDAATKDEDGAEKMRLYLAAVAAVVPDMPREQIEDLSAEQVLAILNLSSTQVGIVEEAAADPNAESSAPKTTTEPTPALTSSAA